METPGTENSRRRPRRMLESTLQKYQTEKEFSGWGHVLDVFPIVVSFNAPIICEASIIQRRKRQPTSVFLPGKSHGQRSLAGYS